MTETYRAEDLRTESSEHRSTGIREPHNRNQPFASPLDMVAGVLILLQIWGPLAAGAFLHR